MKKLIICILMLFMVLFLSACSSDQSSNSLTTVTPQEEVKEETKQEEVIEETKEEAIVEEIEEEPKEEVKEEKKEIKDPTKMKYWVVFFDHDGTELQREALKYGTTPTYWGDIPSYSDADHWYKFVGWTNKKGQDKPFKPIVGNTYFFAKYEVGGEISHESSSGSTPTPSGPACTSTNPLIYIVSYIGPGATSNSYEVSYRFANIFGGVFSGWSSIIGESGGSYLQCDTPMQAGLWYHQELSSPYVPCTDPNHHGAPTP